jgi:hypothetical protein
MSNEPGDRVPELSAAEIDERFTELTGTLGDAIPRRPLRWAGWVIGLTVLVTVAWPMPFLLVAPLTVLAASSVGETWWKWRRGQLDAADTRARTARWSSLLLAVVVTAVFWQVYATTGSLIPPAMPGAPW